MVLKIYLYKSMMFIVVGCFCVFFSIIIVAVSNVIALGFMPLNLWMFSRSWETTVVVPYLQTVISLVMIMVPVGVGMLILRRSVIFAKWISMVNVML